MFLSIILCSTVLHFSFHCIYHLHSVTLHLPFSLATLHLSIYPYLPQSLFLSPSSPSISPPRWLVSDDCVRSSSPYMDVPHHYSIHFPTRHFLQQSDQLRCHYSTPPWLLRHVHTRYSSKLCSFSQVYALPC